MGNDGHATRNQRLRTTGRNRRRPATRLGRVRDQEHYSVALPSVVRAVGECSRGSLARVRHDHAWVVAAAAPECRLVGVSGRADEQIDHLRRLASDDREAIRLLAQSRSLRDLATEFGVSHETVRSVLRR